MLYKDSLYVIATCNNSLDLWKLKILLISHYVNHIHSRPKMMMRKEWENPTKQTINMFIVMHIMLCVHFVLERERERRKEGRGNSQETLPFSFTHFVILHFSFCLSFRRSMFWIYILSDQLMLQKYNVSCSFWNASKIRKRPTLSFNIMKIVILVPKYSIIIITTTRFS